MLYRHFSGLYQPILVIAVLFLALSCIACSSTPLKLEHTPTRESDFQLPPEELKAKFADVEGLHPLMAMDYILDTTKHSEDGKHSMPHVSNLVEVFGEPDDVKGFTFHPQTIMASPFFDIGTLALETPVVGATFMTLPIVARLFSAPEKKLIWYKGNYSITAETFAGGDRIGNWQWQYLPKGQEGPAVDIVDHQLTPYFFGMFFNRPLYANQYPEYELNHMAYGGGYTFRPSLFMNNIHVDMNISLVSFSRKEDRGPIDLSQLTSSISATWDINNKKNEIGFGVWYDVSVADALEVEYQGKIGLFSEIAYYKARFSEHALRIGYVRYLQNDVSDKQHFARVQFINRFRWRL